MPIHVPLTPFIPRRKRRTLAPAAPVLVAASFDAGDPTLTLVFDRAVTLDGPFEATAVVVRDGDNVYDGAGGAMLVNPTTVAVGMVLQDVQPGTGTSLTATSATGIVATVGGISWAGVTGLALPWP